MTERGAHKLYTTCTQAVHTAGAALLLLSIPATAQIEVAVAHFEARCLTPMADPRLEVEIDRDAMSMSLTVIEMNLES